jgi:hypothetical protein
MVELQPSPTELTTAATDLILALACAGAVWRLVAGRPGDAWRRHLWSAVFALVGLASLLGVVVHGVVLPAALAAALWHPLYLGLGLAVALILVGAVLDARGRASARRGLWPALATGLAAYGVTQALDGAFVVFLVYQGLATGAALALYAGLAVRGGLPGAATVTVALALNLAAAAVQASDLSLRLVWPFDHNGLFHLLLLPALGLLYAGIAQGQSQTRCA